MRRKVQEEKKMQKDSTLLEWKNGTKCKKQKIIRKQEEPSLNIYSVMSMLSEMEHGQSSRKCKINTNTSGTRKLWHWLALFLAGWSVFNNNAGELQIEGWSLSRLLWLILCSECEKQKSCQTTNPLFCWWGVKVTLHFFFLWWKGHTHHVIPYPLQWSLRGRNNTQRFASVHWNPICF